MLNPMLLSTLFTAALVFLRAFQQQNVIGAHYLSAIVTSYTIAFAEIGVVLMMVEYQWASAPYIGSGGAIGVTLAMITHRKIFKLTRGHTHER